jgi:hypothetical protein
MKAREWTAIASDTMHDQRKVVKIPLASCHVGRMSRASLWGCTPWHTLQLFLTLVKEVPLEIVCVVHVD